MSSRCELLFPDEVTTLHQQEFHIERASRYAYSLLFFVHGISMANWRLDLKPTRATSPQAIPPDSPLRRRYPPRIAEEDPLVSVRITRSSVQKKSYEVDTGLPPSKKFKIPSLDLSQSFYQRWILLPPEESAKFYTNPYALDTQAPSSRSPYHTLRVEDCTPPNSTYKHKQYQTTTMPYNNTAIPPPEEITGVASLPCQFP